LRKLKRGSIFAHAFEQMCSLKQIRVISSAGLEHLPYKQRVGGSNPSLPTQVHKSLSVIRKAFFILIAIANQVFTIFARLAGFIILPLAQE